MFTKAPFTVAIIWLHSALALSMGYPLCITEPALSLEAGKSPLSVTVHSPMEIRCEATMHFSDPAFLPIRYSFGELECDGNQVLAFTVPSGAPNGDVDIIWQCTGLAPSCSHGVIFGGSADMSISSELAGDIGCLVESVQTKTAPITVTRSSRTFVEMAPTVVVTSTTSFLRKTRDQTTTKTWRTETKTSADPIESETEGNLRSTDTAESLDATTSGGTYTVETLTATTPGGTDTTETFATTSGSTGLGTTDPTTAQTSAATLGLDLPQKAVETAVRHTDDDVFMSDATKMTVPLLPAVTASIISTLTIIHTVTASCTG
ncbi:hypothetical protein F53441_8303 [Fusarium austroafricanum]|uniref:Uncharacterized protein n=1 Tax=Fusarium austroafricanum TaxID=2364996 RepID=A0A8H4KFR8_9HYPO|nr:hypothetical protein F53441_8303 [Fusarium austroafricanum]